LLILRIGTLVIRYLLAGVEAQYLMTVDNLPFNTQ